MKWSKKVVLSVTALSALMCGSFDNSVEAAKSKADIIFGVAYYDEYMPYERLEKDMQMIKNANMNTIRIAESTWGTMEPSPGNFDFHHIDRVLAAAQKYDLQVVVGLPTYAIPAWMAFWQSRLMDNINLVCVKIWTLPHLTTGNALKL